VVGSSTGHFFQSAPIPPELGWLMRTRRKLFGDYGLLGRYARHSDRNQENLFFELLRECLEKGLVSEAEIKDAMSHDYVRHDALEVIAQVPPLSKAA
jgi:hypothetical protein